MRTSHCRRPSLLGAEEPRVPRPQEPRRALLDARRRLSRAGSPATTVVLTAGGWGSRVRGGEPGGEREPGMGAAGGGSPSRACMRVGQGQ